MSTGGYQGMDRVEIVAYKAFVAVDLKRPVLTPGRFASHAPQEGRNPHTERRCPDADPLAYFRSKPVQTMGGSSDSDKRSTLVHAFITLHICGKRSLRQSNCLVIGK